ncbi:deoxyguanosinetriphosphate triphosphohydrolase [Gemmatimonas aurantiaca]|nr:deoxyguanosinetriphosphate triphosphohydrolase [Gemmatimonas aurantiaca]
MINRRQELENLEAQNLASYAMLASASRGRKFAIEESLDRTCFQRDYDRIVHAKAFRRMEYKTQVFVYSEGDHYRTRLTHSMEVAQVCRSITRALGLNVDLAEAVALAHDLGHPPFGHAGEKALDEALITFGGFNHNEQSLRVIDYLEQRYPNHPGLNLSYEVREGIAKHLSEGASFDPEEFPRSEAPTLEAAVVDLADEIAYNSHDVDDGLDSGMLSLADLGNETDCALPSRALAESKRQNSDLSERLRRYDVVRKLVGWQIRDLVENIAAGITKFDVKEITSAREHCREIIRFSESMRSELDQLREFLLRRLYRHPRVIKMTDSGQETVSVVFDWLLADPAGRLPEAFRSRLGAEAAELVIRDYVAGMTDRFAEQIRAGV